MVVGPQRALTPTESAFPAKATPAYNSMAPTWSNAQIVAVRAGLRVGVWLDLIQVVDQPDCVPARLAWITGTVL